MRVDETRSSSESSPSVLRLPLVGRAPPARSDSCSLLFLHRYCPNALQRQLVLQIFIELLVKLKQLLQLLLLGP